VQAIGLADRLGDLDLALSAHFLADEGHGEERRQMARADGLSRSRMKDRLGRHREVGDDVVPALRDALLVEDELGPLGWIAIDAHVALTHRCSSSQGSCPLSGRLRPRNPHCVRHGLEPPPPFVSGTTEWAPRARTPAPEATRAATLERPFDME